MYTPPLHTDAYKWTCFTCMSHIDAKPRSEQSRIHTILCENGKVLDHYDEQCDPTFNLWCLIERMAGNGHGNLWRYDCSVLINVAEARASLSQKPTCGQALKEPVVVMTHPRPKCTQLTQYVPYRCWPGMRIFWSQSHRPQNCLKHWTVKVTSTFRHGKKSSRSNGVDHRPKSPQSANAINKILKQRDSDCLLHA